MHNSIFFRKEKYKRERKMCGNTHELRLKWYDSTGLGHIKNAPCDLVPNGNLHLTAIYTSHQGQRQGKL